MSTPEPTSPDQAAIVDWIRNKWTKGVDSPCECCGHIDWAIPDPIVLSVRTQAFPHSGEMPLGIVICQTCANVRWINMLALASIRDQGRLV